MVTKEQRRGTRQDLHELREFAIKYYYEHKSALPKGMVGIRFGWSLSKIYGVMKMAAEAFDDLDLIGGQLWFLGPYETFEETDENDN